MKANQQAIQKKSKKGRQSQSNSKEQSFDSDEQSEDDNNLSYDSSFVNDDEEVQQQYYPRPFLDNDPYKSKKKAKKEKQKRKQVPKPFYRRGRQNNDIDQDDFELLEQNDQNKTLKRLKKNKKREENYDDNDEKENQQLANQDDQPNNINDDEDQFEDGQREKYNQYDAQSESVMNQVIDDQKGIQDIFEPGDLMNYQRDLHDKEIVELDIPQRQLIQIMNHAKVSGQSIEQTIKQFQSDDKAVEARWIYQRLRINGYLQTNDERSCRQKIFHVLNCLHKENLEIMYIYYYRKKLYSDILTLQILWKIQEYDEQWISFKEQHNKLKNSLVSVIGSMQQVPKQLIDMINSCNDIRILKYFKQYRDFEYLKINYEKKSTKSNLISQVRQKGVAQWIQNTQIFLRPHNLCTNLKVRMQQKKPKTPIINPQDQIEKLFARNRYQQDQSRFPLLAPKFRLQTIIRYLQQQLFNYPQLRKILKQRYLKKLNISTTPTKKGDQDINLYSLYFPVKRIKDKLISTLKRQVWILATEAEKAGLIRIDLKFEWQLSSETRNFQGDQVYLELIKYYFDINTYRQGDIWNLFRKQVLIKMLENHFFPAFFKQVKEDLTKEGQKQIINVACQKFRSLLNKGPAMRDGKPNKILAMVLQNQKLGMAFVDQNGDTRPSVCIPLLTDDDLKRFVHDEMLFDYVQENKPDLIVISANCRKAQTLRKQLRTPNLFEQKTIFVAYGEYQVSSLVAKKKILKGETDQRPVLQAISMARMKQNPMAEILSLWSDKVQQNGVLQMNFHPLIKSIDPRKLKDALEKVAIQVVSLVGINLNLLKSKLHYQNQLQFICGLGPRKAYDFLERMKQCSQIFRREDIKKFVNGQKVYKNCAPFFRIQTNLHKALLQKQIPKQKKKGKIKDQQEINLLDMTRIPQQWYKLTEKLALQALGMINLTVMKQKKQYSGMKDQLLATIELFKNPQKLRTVEIDKRSEEYISSYFDEQLVKSQIMNRFKNPRQIERNMENKETFFNLLKQSPQTLKRYMIFTVKIVSVSSQYLNVVISQNGLFGFIKIHQMKKQYQKGNHIKALIIGFPFDQKKYKDRSSEDQQQLLKVQMALNFPHKSQDRSHDCFIVCFPFIVKQIHPLIDLQKDRFQLRKQDRPVIQVKQQVITRIRTQYRRISHPKYKNVNSTAAVQIVKSQSIGDFIIRPSSQGSDFLVITWHFYKDVVAHIKIKSQPKSLSNANLVYRIMDRDKDKTFSTIDEIIEKYIKPMNAIVQDMISNKKFLSLNIEQIQEKVKTDNSRDSNLIHYYFGCNEEYPQFFILVYIYKEKKPIKQLIKVRSSGLYFHEQQFQAIRDLISWFKDHLKDREYQRYTKTTALKK